MLHLFASVPPRLTPRSEVLTVVEDQMVLRLTEAALSSLDGHIWCITYSVSPRVDRMGVGKLVDGCLPYGGIGLLTDLASVMDDSSVPGVNPVVSVAEAMNKDMIPPRHSSCPPLVCPLR